MTDTVSLVAAYSRIRDLRQEQDVLMDVLYAQEELGEISTELLQLRRGEKSDCSNLQEEALDLAICALSIYIGAGGKVQNVIPTVTRKLDKWQETQDQILGLYRSSDSGNLVEVRKTRNLYQGFNVETGTTYNSPCPKMAMESLLELFKFEKTS